MGQILDLLECASENLHSTNEFRKALGESQMEQANKLLERGCSNEDDLDESLKKFPDCYLRVPEFSHATK